MNFERLVQRTAATLLMSMICLISLAQSRTVSGVVLDSRGDPVIGANIRVVSDASIGTITDLDGKFSLAGYSQTIGNKFYRNADANSIYCCRAAGPCDIG